jgi:hypothetical protein
MVGVCRTRAAELFESALAEDEDMAEVENNDMLVLVDVYRRIGEFESAMEWCEVALDVYSEEPVLVGILEYQITLIEEEDTGVYTVGDVPDIETLTE